MRSPAVIFLHAFLALDFQQSGEGSMDTLVDDLVSSMFARALNASASQHAAPLDDASIGKASSGLSASSMPRGAATTSRWARGQQRHFRAPATPVAAKKGGDTGGNDAGPYRKTVILPQTCFNMRANSVTKEPEIQKWWLEEGVYSRLAQKNPGPTFVLHDGPPYANGDLHIGHALNKILKDFINRYKALRGLRVRYVPGWDCHGLPIELKVLQSLPREERRELGSMDLRKKAKKFAEKTVNSQSLQFRRYGVWGEFEEPYLTLRPEYEAAQIEVFGRMFLKGHIYRGLKPVYWSPSSGTALAEAELEYPEGHISRSIYVGMRAMEIPDSAPQALRDVADDLAFSIWTTTPWTMPANLAIAINPDLEYALVKPAASSESSEEPKAAPLPWPCGHLVVAKGLVEDVAAKLSRPLEVVATFPGRDIEGCSYQHPLSDRVSRVVAGGDYITTESGTGLVHTAPGHGADDYLTGLKYGLELLSPVDDAGNFTAEAGERFKGMNVLGDGNKEVISALREKSALLAEMAYNHKYPYDWRTKKPTIVRATEQWFASVDGFRDDALKAISGVQWLGGEGGEARISNMVSGRKDWCISRQRTWGLPIPVFYDKRTGEPLMNEKTLSHVQAVFAQRGSDAWFYLPTGDLLPEEYRADAEHYDRGNDTMDVWFDSGSSWASVVKQRGMETPVDLYLEGSDQHRGWFQSSLLTSVAATGGAPYKSVLTHGFVMDEKGMKMSKSLGNVIDPRIVIEGGKDQKKDPAYGADVLRLWVSSVDYASDVLIGSTILKQTMEKYRKLRGTIRFLMGCLDDFDPAAHAVPYAKLPQVDRLILSRTAQFLSQAEASFDTYAFQEYSQEVTRFAVVELSNFYLDVAKDRLYIQATDSSSRRACQTTLQHVLLVLLKTLAPITPHTAEDAWRCLPDAFKDGKVSIFESGWPEAPKEWTEQFGPAALKDWDQLLSIRGEVNRVIEKARNAKLIGSALEAQAYLQTDDASLHQLLISMTLQGDLAANGVDQLKYLFLTSDVHVVDTREEVRSTAGEDLSEVVELEGGKSLAIGVCRADGKKCERCWHFSKLVGANADHPTLCERCVPVVVGMGMESRPA
jgi:isoleucyl-tRNA synthetase